MRSPWRLTDDAFSAGTREVTVTVSDVNEGPVVSGVQSLSFVENLEDGPGVGGLFGD